MRAVQKIALLLAAFVLSSVIAIEKKPKMAAGTWGYNAFLFMPDSSFRTGGEKMQLNFVTVDRSNGVNTHKIALVFNKLPTADGEFKIVDVVSTDSEAAVNVSDGSPGFSYVSKGGSDNYIHVRFKDKQCYFWANDVSMKCLPRFA